MAETGSGCGCEEGVYSGEAQVLVSYINPHLREGFDDIAWAGAIYRYPKDLDEDVERISEQTIEMLHEVSSK